MVKRLFYCIGVIAIVCGVTSFIFLWQQHVEGTRFAVPLAPAASLAKAHLSSHVAAPGFVEPVSKELRLGFDMSGVIEKLLVKEGDTITSGQPLAQMRQAEYEAAVQEAQAKMLEAKANKEMHIAGARAEEREQVIAELHRAEIRYEQAQRELERRKVMIRSRAIGNEELERAEQDARVTRNELSMARQEYALTLDRYRKEEQEMASQRLEAAEGALKQAQATLDKSMLRSPINGTVLRIFSDPGEAYSIFSPAPVLSVGDISTLNVRVEVDERDVGKVKLGQNAFVAADAFGDTKFNGKVSRLELSMTPKKTRSGDPSEPVDRSVLEVLVTLDAPGPFVSGMRVDVYIETTAP